MLRKFELHAFLVGLPLWAGWILASLLGAGVTFALVSALGVLGAMYSLGEGRAHLLPVFLVTGLIDGGLNGLFQWFLLRKHLQRAWRWILVTCVTTALGWCLLLFIPVPMGYVPQEDFTLPIYVIAVCKIVAAPFQWWLIHRERGARWWMPVSLIGWGCADLAAVVMNRDSALMPWWSLLLAVLIGSMFTALVIVWLYDRSPRRTSARLGPYILTALLLLAGWGTVEFGFSQQIRSLHGHIGFIRSVVFSPDGKLLASASEEGNVILWEVASGVMVRTINVNRLDSPGSFGNGNDVERVLFSPDGNLLVTASDDGFFKIWEVSSGQKLFEKQTGKSLHIPCLTFSPDSQLLAVMGDNPSPNISLWDIPTHRRMRTLPLQEGVIVEALGVSGDQRVAWLNYSPKSLTWDTVEGTLPDMWEQTWQVAPCSGNLSFSPDAKYLAAGRADILGIGTGPTLALWDLTSGTVISTQPGPGVTVLAYSPDGHTLAVGRNYKDPMLLWDVLAWEEVSQLRGGNNISALAFSPDGRLIASGSLDSTVRLWKAPASR